MGKPLMRLARSVSPYEDGMVQVDLATLLEYNDLKGPKFTAVRSGTSMQETGHVAALLEKLCVASITTTGQAGRMGTQPLSVTIAKLGEPPRPIAKVQSPIPYVTYFATIPVLVSIVTCALSAIYSDWYAFAIILSGTFANGWASMNLGFGTFCFTHPDQSQHWTRGDGILDSRDGCVLLKGAEASVRAVTLGRFLFLFPSDFASLRLGVCSVSLIMQSLAMLILIPQSSFFGQLMITTSLAISWLYNLWVWTFDKEKILHELVKNVLGRPIFTKFILRTHTSMLVFIALALELKDRTEIMRVFAVPSTAAWEKWKELVIERLTTERELKFDVRDWNCDGFCELDKLVLGSLLNDAMVAYDLFKRHEDVIVA